MGEGTDAYAALLADPEVSVVGFEPHGPAYAARNEGATANRRFLPYFVGDGSERMFHHCANPLTSSLYEPDAKVFGLFQNMPIPVVSTERVQTRRLDEIDVVGPSDLLKIDVQGAELDVLKGARGVLARTLVVHAEVEFVPIYKG